MTLLQELRRSWQWRKGVDNYRVRLGRVRYKLARRMWPRQMPDCAVFIDQVAVCCHGEWVCCPNYHSGCKRCHRGDHDAEGRAEMERQSEEYWGATEGE